MGVIGNTIGLLRYVDVDIPAGSPNVQFVVPNGTLPATPVQSALATATTGGTIPAGSVFVKVTAVNGAGESLGSNEQTITTTGSTSTVTASWGAAANAASYNVYVGTAAGAENVVVRGTTALTLTLTALPTLSGTVPTVAPSTVGMPFVGPVDLIGVEVLTKGVTATALKVNGGTVAAGAIASLTSALAGDENGPGGVFGGAYAAKPAPGVSVATTGGTGGNGAPQVNETNVGYQNYATSGAVSGTTSTIVDRNGSVPNPAALVPLSAAIAGNQIVEVDFTGTPAVISTLPAPVNGVISVPTGVVQGTSSTFANVPADSIPFIVKASDTTVETFAGQVRFWFQVAVSDPNTAAKAAGTYPNNGVQKGTDAPLVGSAY